MDVKQMIHFGPYLNKKVRVITMVLFRNGRKINTHYIGVVTAVESQEIFLREIDGKDVSIMKKHIKRIEEIK